MTFLPAPRLLRLHARADRAGWHDRDAPGHDPIQDPWMLLHDLAAHGHLDDPKADEAFAVGASAALAGEAAPDLEAQAFMLALAHEIPDPLPHLQAGHAAATGWIEALPPGRLAETQARLAAFLDAHPLPRTPDAEATLVLHPDGALEIHGPG